MIRCCFECADREIGCHSKCEKYIKEKAEHEHKIKMIREKKNKNQRIDTFEVDRAYRIKKRRVK